MGQRKTLKKGVSGSPNRTLGDNEDPFQRIRSIGPGTVPGWRRVRDVGACGASVVAGRRVKVAEVTTSLGHSRSTKTDEEP